MKLKRLADDIDGYDTDSMTEFSPEYVTEAEQEGTLYALELVCSAAMQSGLKFLRTIVDEEEGYERIVMNAEDAEPAVVMNIVKDLQDSEYEYNLGSQQRSHDVLVFSHSFEPDEAA